MTFGDHLRAVRSSAWILIILVVLGALAGWSVVARQPVTYEAAAQLAIGPRKTSTSTPSSTTMALQDPTMAATLAQIAISGSTEDAAAQTVNLVGTDATISAIVVNQTVVVQITAQTDEAAAAAPLASAVAALASAEFETVYPLFKVTTIVEPGSAEAVAVAPPLGAVVGAVMGLSLGYLLALARAAVRRGQSPGPEAAPQPASSKG